MSVQDRDAPYVPGEPYEILVHDRLTHRTFVGYRCFRGHCHGRVCMVADRNTHNAYHNTLEVGR